jgi:hypothetical protein
MAAGISMQLNYQFELFVGFEADASVNAATLLARLNRVETWQMGTVVKDRMPRGMNEESDGRPAMFVFTRSVSEANSTIEKCYSPGFNFSAEAQRILEAVHDLPAVQMKLQIAHKYGIFYPNFDEQRNFEIVAEMDQPFASPFQSEMTNWKLRLQFDQLVERRNTEDEFRAYETLSLAKITAMFARYGLKLSSIWRSHDLSAVNSLAAETIIADQITASQAEAEKMAWYLATKTNLIKELSKYGRVMTIHLEKVLGDYGAEQGTYIYARSSFAAPASEVLLNLIAS